VKPKVIVKSLILVPVTPQRIIHNSVSVNPVRPYQAMPGPVMSKLAPEIIDATKFSSSQTSDMELPY
jgi:hypothetical protein